MAAPAYFDTNRSAKFALVVMLLLAPAGCGGAAAGRVDENMARAVLTKALNAWVAGASASDLRTQEPAVIIVDHEWTSGVRLVDYELLGMGAFDGNTLRAPVMLTLAQPPRPAKKVSANFIVGLQPVITVVRVME